MRNITGATTLNQEQRCVKMTRENVFYYSRFRYNCVKLTMNNI